MDRGESQYRNGKEMFEHAVGGLGPARALVGLRLSPGAGAGVALGVDVGDLVAAVKVAEDLGKGKPLLQTVAIAYGQDLVDMAFSSYDTSSFLGGQLETTVSDALKDYAKDGRIDLKGLADRSMQRVGEDLYRGASRRLAGYLEKELSEASVFSDLKKTWDAAKQKVEENRKEPFHRNPKPAPTGQPHGD